MGVRLIEDFLARTTSTRCLEMRETADKIQQAFRLVTKSIPSFLDYKKRNSSGLRSGCGHNIIISNLLLVLPYFCNISACPLNFQQTSCYNVTTVYRRFIKFILFLVEAVLFFCGAVFIQQRAGVQAFPWLPAYTFYKLLESFFFYCKLI